MKSLKTLTIMLALFCLTFNASASADSEENLEILSIGLNKGTMIHLSKAADSIFVADPEVADVQIQSSKLVHIFAKEFGETNVFVIGKDGEVLYSRRIVVEYNTSALKDAIKRISPESDVYISTLEGSLMLTGSVASAEAARDITVLASRVAGDPSFVISQLRVASPSQVNLRVRIAEVSRQISKQLGFKWDVSRTFGDMAVGIATRGLSTVAGGITGNAALAAAGSIGSTDVNVIVDALDEQGLITVLAEPNLTAMSGETARFLVGGEFPIPVAYDNDNITIEFKEYGVGLTFLPIVLADGRIYVKVETEVSQLSDEGAIEISGFVIPGLTTRQADTTVNLGSGQSFAIAGLLKEETDQTVDKYPGLADLPILGPLFTSTEFERAETELVVIVTPYLVRPVSTQLALPTDGFTPASDRDRMLSGDLHSNQIADGNTGLVDGSGRVGPVGPVGFILR